MAAGTQKTGKRGGKRSTSWKPGQSGNSKGRQPDEELAKVREAAADFYGPLEPLAYATFESVMREGKSESARVAAANSVVDRVRGKAPQEVKVSGFEDWSTEKLIDLLPAALEALKGASK